MSINTHTVKVIEMKSLQAINKPKALALLIVLTVVVAAGASLTANGRLTAKSLTLKSGTGQQTLHVSDIEDLKAFSRRIRELEQTHARLLKSRQLRSFLVRSDIGAARLYGANGKKWEDGEWLKKTELGRACSKSSKDISIFHVVDITVKRHHEEFLQQLAILDSAHIVASGDSTSVIPADLHWSGKSGINMVAPNVRGGSWALLKAKGIKHQAIKQLAGFSLVLEDPARNPATSLFVIVDARSTLRDCDVYVLAKFVDPGKDRIGPVKFRLKITPCFAK